MDILFLDDAPDRHAVVDSLLPSNNVTHVWTVDDAIKALRSRQWDSVWLDFDLNDYPKLHRSTMTGVYGSVKLTGLDVALVIQNLPEDRRPKAVHIHSWNDDGAAMIAKALEGYVSTLTKEPFSFPPVDPEKSCAGCHQDLQKCHCASETP